MKKYVSLGIVLILTGGSGLALANEIFVSGNPSTLIITTATAGAEPLPVTDASTTYSIDILDSNMKITGSIDTAMPANTTLSVTLTAPSGGSSAGAVSLTASAQDLVTSIETVAESGITISYSFSATAAAGVIASAQKTVTFTVADE